MTLSEISDWLSNNPQALEYPNEALRFYNFWANEDECVLMEVNEDNLPDLWDEFAADVQTYQSANKRMSVTEQKSQYWDFIYSQLGNMELREYFSNQRSSISHSDRKE